MRGKRSQKKPRKGASASAAARRRRAPVGSSKIVRVVGKGVNKRRRYVSKKKSQQAKKLYKKLGLHKHKAPNFKKGNTMWKRALKARRANANKA